MYSKFKLAIEKEIKINPELWTRLQEFGEIRHLKKNEYLLKVGQVCRHGYYINAGSLVQTFQNHNGKEIVQGFYIDDDFSFLTSISSYFSEQSSNFQIKALENCEILEFSKSHLEQMSKEFLEFSIYYHKITSWGFQNLYMFSAMRLSLDAEEFLLFLYKQHPIYMQRIPDKYIAKFMGISKEWLSKLKKKILKPNIQDC
ncbi:MAG TPA: Crp/Fnr family transcriptional regulator [Prolixibacteraceae bacterium]|nr:Crp/Fnr family transcriptional regulator [Prolixibacteraceae bacterium]